MGKLSKKGVIASVIQATDRLPPIIVDFQNGDIHPDAVDCLDFSVHRCAKTKQRMVSTTIDGLGYRGLCKSTMFRRFIAIKKKSTKEVKLVEAAMCTLSPVFEQSKSVKLDMSTNKIKGELAKAYGTKARRMYAILDETLKLDTDQVKQAAAGVDLTEKQLGKANEVGVNPVFEILPPHNRESKLIEEVYKVEDILVEEILYYFDEEVQRIMNSSAEELKAENLSEFFFSTWEILQLKDGSNMDKRILLLKSLLFVECLGHLLQTNASNLRKDNFNACYFSGSLSEYILNVFTSNTISGRTCPKAQQDKAICYVLVLCFFIFDYKVDISPLVKVTKSSITRLTQLCRAIGARVDKQRIATLRMPLADLPKPRNVKNKK